MVILTFNGSKILLHELTVCKLSLIHICVGLPCSDVTRQQQLIARLSTGSRSGPPLGFTNHTNSKITGQINLSLN